MWDNTNSESNTSDATDTAGSKSKVYDKYSAVSCCDIGLPETPDTHQSHVTSISMQVDPEAEDSPYTKGDSNQRHHFRSADGASCMLYTSNGTDNVLPDASSSNEPSSRLDINVTDDESSAVAGCVDEVPHEVDPGVINAGLATSLACMDTDDTLTRGMKLKKNRAEFMDADFTTLQVDMDTDATLSKGKMLKKDEDEATNADCTTSSGQMNTDATPSRERKYKKSVAVFTTETARDNGTRSVCETRHKVKVTNIDMDTTTSAAGTDAITLKVSYEGSRKGEAMSITESVHYDINTSVSETSHTENYSSTDESSHSGSSFSSSSSDSDVSSKSEWSSSETEGHVCLFCKAEFETPAYLEAHKRSRACLVVYKCALCNRSFRQRIPMKIHMNTHWKKFATDIT